MSSSEICSHFSLTSQCCLNISNIVIDGECRKITGVKDERIISICLECSIAPILHPWATSHSERTQTSDYVCWTRYQSRTSFGVDNKKVQQRFGSATVQIHTSLCSLQIPAKNFQILCSQTDFALFPDRDARWDECMSVCQHSPASKLPSVWINILIYQRKHNIDHLMP